MKSKPITKKVKIDSIKVNKSNIKAIKSFQIYKKTDDLIQRTNIAMGRKTTYNTTTNSTLHQKIQIHGIISTHKI